MKDHTWWFYYVLLLFILQQEAAAGGDHGGGGGGGCPLKESLALLQFKQSFSIDVGASANCDIASSSPKTQFWNATTTSTGSSGGVDCCNWDGVTCDQYSGHVIGIDLSCSQLQGTIHPNSTLFQLSHLKMLNLAFNYFSLSPIPTQIGSFATTLTHLNLSNSAFSGQIPSQVSLLSKLISLDLSHNDLTLGAASSFNSLLQNLTRLTHLSLASVNISSVFPHKLPTSLTSLDLSCTGLHGTLPGKLFHLLPNLEKLDLSVNKGLTGYIPRGVVVHDQNGTTTSSPLRWLDLSITNLSGQVPPGSIDSLKSLNYLSLSDCHFAGSIPDSIGSLTQLTHLELASNNFTGNVPTTLSNLHQLTHLDLSYNNLQGPIPNIFSSLINLRTLVLSFNLLNGSFPSSVLNLTNLVRLDFSSNSIAGPFPLAITTDHGLQNLTSLILMNNNLIGIVPSWLFALPSLVSLSLKNNQLSGPLQDFQSQSLEFIDLSSNNFHGPIPQSISKLLNLSSLDLYGNNLTGVVELDMFSNLVNLQYLDLSNNNLVLSSAYSNLNATLEKLDTLRLSFGKLKEFPKFLIACKSLRLLDLSYNEIRGQIPNWVLSMWGDSLNYLNLTHNSITGAARLPWKNLGILDLRSNLFQEPLPLSICDMSKLEILDMAYNSIGGAIHQCFGNFSDRLTVLNLRANRLSGTIPTTFAEPSSLRNLNFNGNWLKGSLPRSLIHCKHLQVLDLGNNRLNDIFPEWLETLSDLQVLVLRSNRLHGPIRSVSTINHPFPKLRVLDLSKNAFTGLLPTEYISNFECMRNTNQSLKWLQYMGEDGYHEYYDTMTVAMKGLEQNFDRILTVFTAVDLSSNKFQGEISYVIGYLNSLKVLNLSHNSLTGHIPTTLGTLSQLESLDLSSNQLVGRIPQQLAGLNALSVLNLSLNHLEGPIPRGPQFNTFGNDSYAGNSALCGFPMSKSCSGVDHPPISLLPGVEDDDDSIFWSGFTWKAVVMGYGTGTAVGLLMGYLMLLTGKPKWLTASFKL